MMTEQIVRPNFSIIVFGLLLGAVRFDNMLLSNITTLEYGLSSFTPAMLSVVLGLISGILLMVGVFPRRSQTGGQLSGGVWAVLLLGIIPLLGVLLKLLLALFGEGVLPVSFLRPFWNELYHWTLTSQMPAVWLGLVIGYVWPKGLTLT